MVLLVLAVVWVVALTPMVLRKLSERRVVTSVTSFNRHLGRLRSRSVWDESTSEGLSPIGFSAAAQRVREEPRFDAGVVTAPTTDPAEPIPVVTSKATVARRRRVMTILLGATVGSFLLGLVPALSFFWDLALVGLVCTISYLGLLVYFHRMAVERASKVVALETRRQCASALDRARAVGAAPPPASTNGGGPAQMPLQRAVGGSTWSITGSHAGTGAGAATLGARARLSRSGAGREFAGARS